MSSSKADPNNYSSTQERIVSIQSKYQNAEWEQTFHFFKKRMDYHAAGRSHKTFRHVTPGIADKQVVSNQVSTSKYNLISFLPKNLFIQFSRKANLFFILIGGLQMIQTISTTNGVPAIYLPLSIITAICMIKDFIEDRFRHNADKKDNESKVQWLNPETSVIEEVFWQNLHIGDIVKIDEGQAFPADIAILQTTQTNGDCFVETKNLDGETNLKRKVGIAPQVFQKYDIKNVQEFFNYQLKYEQPHQQMYNFSGVLFNESGTQYPVNNNNLCLRGSSLQATDSVYGVVVYTGHETKIYLNSLKVRYKFSKIELVMNGFIFWVFVMLFAVCLFSASYYQVWIRDREDSTPYLDISKDSFDSHNAKTFFLYIPLWIILLAHFVPISLMVTLEIVKFGQGQILQRDRNFKNINDDEYVDVKSCNLCEELGKVKYIFSDKTGTLTVNQMIFKSLCLNKVLYEHNSDSSNTQSILKSEKLNHVIRENVKSRSFEMEGLNCLNLCHTLTIERKGEKLIFNGTSPDEESILDFCYNQGYYFSNENVDKMMEITSTQIGDVLKFQKIAVLEFSFERKRMSVIVKDLQTSEYKLYCKGADMSIFQTCAQGQEEAIQHTQSSLDYFSVKGLRTLAFGYKILTKQQVDSYLNRLLQIKAEIANTEEKEQELNIEMESNLILLGGTGINDRLQDDIEYTLKNLKTAGINIWMLTGDKVETAQNIANQCNLINSNTDLMILDHVSFKQETEEMINLYYEKIGKVDFSVLITGHTLYAIENHCRSSTVIEVPLENPSNKKSLNTQQKLQQILLNSSSVIACKVTPRQKAEIVHIVKKLRPDDITLAIGDGANDVSMITTAHIGVGIRGKEGREAAKISDFSIGEFKHLNRLILYYGQETYRKNTQLVFFNFYKNQVGFLVYFWYNFFSAQSGTYFYDQWVKELYNLIFTSLPIILFAWFDEIYPAHEYCTLFHTLPNQLEKMPLYYKKNLENPAFSTFNFWKELFKGTVQAVFTTYVGLVFINDVSNKHQRQASHLDVGMLVFTLAVILPNLRVFQLHKTHFNFTIFFQFLSVLVFIIALLIASKIKSLDSFGMTQSLLSVGGFYLGIFFAVLTIYCIQRAFDDWSLFTLMMENQNYQQVFERDEMEKNTIFSSDQKMIPQNSKEKTIFADGISLTNNKAINSLDEENSKL